ncbi:MAG: hypothetical protein HY741_11945 [Chloroflexi bacterium]|nr:hypothetical protein [Chloroflexota bacterium]
MPLASADETTRTCVTKVVVALDVPAKAKRVIKLDLEFAGKGAAGFDKNASKSYAQGLLLTSVVSNAQLPAPLRDTTGIALVGNRLRGIGGFVFDDALEPRVGWIVRVKQAQKKIGETKTDANGFFVVRVPVGGPYTVQLIDPATNDVLATAEVDAVGKKQFVKVNFNQRK